MDLFNIILRPTDLWEYVLHRKLTGGSSLVEVGTSTDPYFFRPSPSFSGATYSKERDKVVGGSVGWNQLVDSSTSSVTIPSGHKYFGKIGSTKTIASSSGSAISVTGGSDMLIDLTQMFGSTIADHAYSLESQTSGKGVEFISKLIDLTTYHAYDSGSIKSVEGLQSHDMTGANIYDFSQGRFCYINAKKGDTLYVKSNHYASFTLYAGTEGAVVDTVSVPYSGNATALTLTGDITRFAIPQGTYDTLEASGKYLMISFRPFTDIEPYHRNSYPLDSSLTLRGVPKLSNGAVYYDGDTYESDGTVTRKYGVRAYQSGDESDPNVVTDKTNTVYKLTTPTTETADPYTNPQSVDPYGTEEYVTSGLVAVGHETSYLGKFESVGFGLGNPSAPSEDEPSEEAEEPSEEVTEEITEDSEEPAEEADE